MNAPASEGANPYVRVNAFEDKDLVNGFKINGNIAERVIKTADGSFKVTVMFPKNMNSIQKINFLGNFQNKTNIKLVEIAIGLGLGQEKKVSGTGERAKVKAIEFSYSDKTVNVAKIFETMRGKKVNISHYLREIPVGSPEDQEKLELKKKKNLAKANMFRELNSFFCKNRYEDKQTSAPRKAGANKDKD